MPFAPASGWVQKKPRTADYLILLFHRRSAIKFNPLVHPWLAGWARFKACVRYRQVNGGPSVVAENLRRELKEQSEWHWAESFRDRPATSEIDTIWVVE